MDWVNLMNRPTSNLFPFVNVFITTSALVQNSFSTTTPSHNLWSICPLCAVVPLWSVTHFPWCYKSSSPLGLVDIKLSIQKCLLDHPDRSWIFCLDAYVPKEHAGLQYEMSVSLLLYSTVRPSINKRSSFLWIITCLLAVALMGFIFS